jgi:hypothetical protein
VIIYVAAFFATTDPDPHSGSYLLSARTEALQ